MVSHWWGCYDPAYKGTLSNHVVHCLKRVEPFWFWIYNWSTAWPITFKEIILFDKYYVTLGHVLLIALVNIHVSSLHPTRKGWLKWIIVRIWFPERSPDLPSWFVTMSICVSSQLLTPVTLQVSAVSLIKSWFLILKMSQRCNLLRFYKTMTKNKKKAIKYLWC